jgi:hypothetical protein
MPQSGGGEGGGIAGDKPIEQWLKQYSSLVAQFRVDKMNHILSQYDAKENLTVPQTQFLLRCLADVVDQLG